MMAFDEPNCDREKCAHFGTRTAQFSSNSVFVQLSSRSTRPSLTSALSCCFLSQLGSLFFSEISPTHSLSHTFSTEPFPNSALSQLSPFPTQPFPNSALSDPSQLSSSQLSILPTQHLTNSTLSNLASYSLLPTQLFSNSSKFLTL